VQEADKRKCEQVVQALHEPDELGGQLLPALRWRRAGSCIYVGVLRFCLLNINLQCGELHTICAPQPDTSLHCPELNTIGAGQIPLIAYHWCRGKPSH
jgi:hypothetical protein